LKKIIVVEAFSCKHLDLRREELVLLGKKNPLVVVWRHGDYLFKIVD
jgi:hypothetical protein